MQSTSGDRRRGGRPRLALGLAVALIAGTIGGTVGGMATAQSPPPPVSSSPFTDVPAATIDQTRQAATTPGAAEPDTARGLLLDRAAMTALLAGAPTAAGGTLRLALPAPDGTTATFDVWKSAVIAPELAARHPEITTYTGQGVDDPAATIAVDLTPHGFHAQVLSPDGNWYIDPAVNLDDRYHQSFHRADVAVSRDAAFEQTIGQFEEPITSSPDETATGRPDAPVAQRAGAELRIHRLAVAASSGYTDANGGTRALALAAIVTAVNRVNSIFETELAIRLQLVGNNDQVVYESFDGNCLGGAVIDVTSAFGPGNGTAEVIVTTAAPHGLAAGDVAVLGGLTSSLNGAWAVRSVTSSQTFVLRGSAYTPASLFGFGAMARWLPFSVDCAPYNNLGRDLEVNQAVLDLVIGDGNYDVGHVFTTASGGLAAAGIAGVSDQKARGTSGVSFGPTDGFFVDIVAHELGHQYGASHTFNSPIDPCGQNWGGPENGLEPGSGSTIMAYAGLCDQDNLQYSGNGQDGDGSNASDPYFHSRSFDQINAHVRSGFPVVLPTPVPNGNAVPTVDAGPNITIPTQTPFFLSARGSDANGDTLTYQFEQRDGGQQTQINIPEMTAGPLFRSFPATTDDTHFFPRLPDVSSNSTNQNVGCVDPNGSKQRADCWTQFLIPVFGALAIGSSRAMNFRAIVRDNRAGGGGVNTDDTVVTVHNTGARFKITSPAWASPNYTGTADLEWDVAGTNAAPIYASTVSVRLSTDGGLSYPIMVAHRIPNDGAHTVTLPNENMGQVRFMVHSGDYERGSGFFDVNDRDVSISAYPDTVPSAPLAPQAVAGDGQATVSWVPPATDGGPDITGYTVTASPGGQSCATAGALSCTIGGLANAVNHSFAVVATNTLGDSPAATTSLTAPRAPRFTPVRQQRLEDTRPLDNVGADDGGGAPFRFNVLGRNGVPESGVGAVSLNITVDRGEQPTIGGGYATVWNCVGARPTASNLNFHTNKPVPNAVITPVSPTGDVCVYVYGTADLLIDVNGYFPTGSDFTPVPQRRLEDTRPNGKIGNPAGTGTPFTFNVLNRAGLPAAGVGAVSLNITVDRGEQPTIGGGYATVWNCVGARPTASNLNFHTNKPVPNAVITPVSPTGDVCVYVYGTADLLIDVNGYFPTGSDFTPVPQRRLEDTRPNGKIGNPAGTGTPFTFNVLNRAGLPAAGVGAVSLNITVDRGEQPTIGGGYATVWNCVGARPTASNLNFHTTKPVPNAVITPVSPTGDVCVYVYGTADLLIDVNGYFPTG